MSLVTRFRAYSATHDLLTEGSSVVVGVSGGLDSVVLLHLMVNQGHDVRAAHVNYGLRGEASEADEDAVRTLCAGLGVPLHVAHPRLEAGNVQAEARRARYHVFAGVAAEARVDTVAVGHHRDDQAETLLLNLFRGAGPVGLAGMAPKRRLARGSAVSLIRPLLFATRDEIQAYADEHALTWREDATNREGAFRRAALRSEVLPGLRRLFPGVESRLADTAERVRAYLDAGAPLSAAVRLDACAERVAGGWACALDGVAAWPAVERHGLWIEALRRWAPEAPRSAAAARQVDALLGAHTGRRIVWGDAVIWRERDRIVFAHATPNAVQTVHVALGDTQTPWGRVSVDELTERNRRYPPSRHVECVDRDRLSLPLELRPWRPGDRLQPLGMTGTKNVSDLLTDRKVPPHERSGQLVLLSEGAVVWAVGHRLAEPFRVRDSTRRIVRIEWHPSEGLYGDHGTD